MRLSKYFFYLPMITCLGLLYAHQHFIILKANYVLKKYEIHLSQLLDHNKRLMYNVKLLEAPAILEAKLTARGIDYDMPRRWAVVREEKSIPPTYGGLTVAERRNLVFERIINFIAGKAEAQALKD